MTAKQEESILQWASHVLMQPVSSLRAVQDVKFVKNLLWRIDDQYFGDWQEGKGNESYSQVMQRVGKYFKEVINTDITKDLQSLNVYRNVKQVWELLIGVAIKGKNRQQNITLIFEMDHSTQAELVKIVTEIIDRFGQNTAIIDQDEQEEQSGQNETQMLAQLAQENEALKQDVFRLENELIKEKQERNAVNLQKKELEQNLQMMRLEKSTFLEVLANANRTHSRIFQDGDSSLQAQSNLSELAQDIVQFIRQQRKSLENAHQANSALEEEVQELRDTVRRCAEENQQYLLRLGDISAYQREIQALRTQVSEKLDQNIALFEQVSSLQEDKARLLINIQRRTQGKTNQSEVSQNHSQLQSYQTPEEQKQQQKQVRFQRKETIKNQEGQRSVNGSVYQGQASKFSQGSEQAQGRKMADQLKEPQLRNKLQRELLHHKKTISGLNKQKDALKKANEALQRSAKAFMQGNQQVINKWEHDYQTLLEQVSVLSTLNQDLARQNSLKDVQNKQMASKLKANQPQKKEAMEDSIDSQSNSEISQQENIAIIISPPNSIAKIPSYQEKQKSKDKTALWDQIVNKVQSIVRDGKTKELAYEKQIQALHKDNFQLIQLLRKGKTIQENQIQDKIEIPILQPPQSPLQDSYLPNIQRVESQELRDSYFHPVRPPRLSYVQIQEGEELEESVISRMKKSHYNVTSKVVNDFTEKRQEASFVSNNEEYYYNLNQRLSSSIKKSLDALSKGNSEEKGGEIQKRLEEELIRIGQQYQKLNNNYQAVFNKLNIYTQNLKEKESLKLGYQEVLQEISKAEAEVTAAHHAEIVTLRLRNEALTKHLTRNALQKQELLGLINSLEASMGAVRKQEKTKQEAALRQMERVVKEASNRYNASLSDPLAFLESCLEISKQEGQLQKFYGLYMKEKERTKQLNEELQLLSSVLLQYRNMILS